MSVVLDSILHMLVDGTCAYALFGFFKSEPGWYMNILLYNFCAFALQMPMGFALDLLSQRKSNKYMSFWVTLAGVAFTVLGVWTHPVVLGIGNALFHIGGGIHTIRLDIEKKRKGSLLGMFVAPGALGLFLGKKYGNNAIISKNSTMLVLILVFALLLALLFYFYTKVDMEKSNSASFATSGNNVSTADTSKTGPALAVFALCFVVVIVRSHVTLAMSFDWNKAFIYALALVLAAVFGKMSGGVAAALWKKEYAIIASLVLAVICFMFGNLPAFGIAAVFFFNMTMPITLYELVLTFPGKEGGMFGVLTFALFLGFIPSYLNIGTGLGTLDGCLAASVSLALLLAAVVINNRRAPKCSI